MISTSESVASGDLVFAATEQGLATQPLRYGTVTRCDTTARCPALGHLGRPGDDARQQPSYLVVLRSALNPARVRPVPDGKSERE